MLRIAPGKVPYYVFEELDALGFVIHGVTTRRGGVSRAPYGTLNLGYHVGDSPDAVRENRCRACAHLGLGSYPVVSGEQVHGTRVAVVTMGDAGREWSPDAPGLDQTDGLLTVTPGLVLSGFFADCAPVFLVDPARKAVGLVHAGKRGTRSGIVRVAIRTMAGAFHTSPADILAAVGPCIGPCCYDMDLPGTIGDELAAAGVLPSNILMSGLCTSCNEQDFFSYRRDSGVTGRMGAYIGIISPGLQELT